MTQGLVTINLFTDSQAAKSLLSRSGPGKRSKHIQLKYLFIQDLIQDGQVAIHKVPTDQNVADLMTKYLSSEVTARHSQALGVHSSAQEIHW